MSDFLALCVVFLCAIGKLYAATTENIKACDGNETSGYVINVVYEEFDAHENCTCFIKPTFTGVLQFASNTINFRCNTEVRIFKTNDPDKMSIVQCGKRKSVKFNVTATSVLSMISKTANFTGVKSFQEIKIFEEITFNSTISVTCGNKTSWSRSTTDRSTWTSGTDDIFLSTAADLFSSMEHTSPSTTDVSLRPIQVDKQPLNKYSDLTYIISGVLGVVVLIIVICIVVYCHKRQKPSKTDGKVKEYSDAHNHSNTGYLDELPDNTLYHSNQPFDEVEYSTVDDQRSDPSSKRQTEEVEKVTKDDTNDVYAKPNKVKSVSAENQNVPDDLNDEILYAQVNKEAKA